MPKKWPYKLPKGDRRHGTANGYNNLGCRCPDCSAANVEQMKINRERRKREIDPDDPRHGTATFYWNYGCRCDPCKAANTEYAAEQRSKRTMVKKSKKKGAKK